MIQIKVEGLSLDYMSVGLISQDFQEVNMSV